MKLVTISILSLIHVLCANPARASEENWMATSLSMPSLMNKVGGFTTDTGAFRMSSVYPAHSSLQIAGGYFSHSDLATATAKCRALAPTLSATRNRSARVYTLSAFVYPFAETELSNLEVRFENKPSLWKSEVSLTVNDKNFLSPDSVNEFERRVNAALESQLENIKKTGRIELTIGQVDDVACALLIGSANLEINFGISFEIAKHIRETMISAPDFAKVYEKLKQKSYKVNGQINRTLVSGALLNDVLRDQFGKSIDDYGISNFIKLAGVLFAPTTGLLQSYSTHDYDSVSQSLDNLKIYPTPAGLKVNLSLELVPQ